MVERLWVPQPPIPTGTEAPVKSLDATTASLIPLTDFSPTLCEEEGCQPFPSPEAATVPGLVKPVELRPRSWV